MNRNVSADLHFSMFTRCERYPSVMRFRRMLFSLCFAWRAPGAGSTAPRPRRLEVITIAGMIAALGLLQPPAMPDALALAAAATPMNGLQDFVAVHDSSGWKLQFEQVAPGNVGKVAADLSSPANLNLSRAKSLQTPGVLLSFGFHYKDVALELREPDGSIYRGSMTPVTVAELTPQTPPNSKSPPKSSPDAVQGNAMNSPVLIPGLYRFQAQGSNQTLKQWVVVQGQLSQAKSNATLLGIAAPSADRGYGWEIQSSVRIGAEAPLSMTARQTSITQGSTPTAPKP